MKLTTNYNEKSIENPDYDAILHALVSTVDEIADLDGESVILLPGPDDDDGILCVQAYYDDVGHSWELFVWRRGHDKVYRAAEGPFSTLRITAILQEHAKGDDSWQRDFHWKPSKTISMNTLVITLVILAALAVAVVLLFYLSR